MTEDLDTVADVTTLLAQAAAGSEVAMTPFFEALLESAVWVPLTGHPQREGEGIAVNALGGNTEDVYGFLRIPEAGHTVIPVFSEERFAVEWAGEERPRQKLPFKTVLWAVSDLTWLHLNPGQAWGKELSPWEIGHLRKGKEAISDVVADLLSAQPEEIEVLPPGEGDKLFFRQIRPLFEAYEEVREAFFLCIVKNESESERTPVLALRTSGVTAERGSRLLDEIHDHASSFYPVTGIEVIPELDQAGGTDRELFDGATPFYVAQITSKKGEPQVSKLRTLLNRLRGQ